METARRDPARRLSMAVDVETLSLLLEVQGNRFESQLRRQNAQAYRIFKTLEDRASAMEKSVGASFGALAGRIGTALGGIAAGVGLNEIRKIADTYTGIINTLKVAGVKDVSGTFDALFASAQKNAVPLEALAQLYGRVSQAQTTLNASSGDLLNLTDIVAQSLRVSGTSATEASGALLQLGQSLAGGKVQAEEYNSLLDGMYPLLQAAAAGLQEAGGDVAKLTALVKDGKVSSEAFFRAIQAGAPLLQDKLAGATLSSAQAMERLQNELLKAVGEFDNATGASKALAGGLDVVAGSIGGIGSAATTAVTSVQKLIGKIGELATANAGAQRAQALDYQAELGRRKGAATDMMLGNSGGRPSVQADFDRAVSEATKRALLGFRADERDYRNALTDAPPPPSRPAGVGGKIKPRSLNEFKVPGDDKGGGGGSSKDALDAYERELAAIQKRTAALNVEAESVGKSTFERAKARAALDLETAAKKAGIPVTAELTRNIDAASTGYANAKVKVEEVTKAYEGVQEAQKFFGDEITDGLTDIIVEGEKAEDVVKNLAKALAKAAIQAALMGSGPLAGVFGTAGSNGNAGGLFGALFSGLGGGGLTPGSGGLYDSGGYTGNGGKNEIAGAVHKGEYVFNKKAVRRLGLGNLEALHRGYANGGGVGMSVPTVPAGMRGGGQPQVKVNVVNNAGAAVQTRQQSNGDITVLIDAMEGRMADRVLRGQGAFSQALGARQSNRHLRG